MFIGSSYVQNDKLCLIKDYWGYRSKYSFVFRDVQVMFRDVQVMFRDVQIYSDIFKLCLECQVMFNKRLLGI